jgi:hypothetical protein
VLLSLRSADLRLDNISMTTKEGRAIGAALIENKYVTALNLSGNRLFNEAFVKTDKNSVGVFKRHADKYIWNGKGIFEALCLPDAKHSDINLRQTQLGAVEFDALSVHLCTRAPTCLRCLVVSFLQMEQPYRRYAVPHLLTQHNTKQANAPHTETRSCGRWLLIFFTKWLRTNRRTRSQP